MTYPRGLELLKWAALLAMLVDHVDLAVFNREQEWMYQIGRFAFPVFAISFGIGLAFTRDPVSVANRLFWPAMVAQCAWAIVDPAHPANVLVLFFCASVVLAAYRWNPVCGLLGVGFLLATAPGLEGGKGGLLLMGAGFIGVSWRPAVVHAVAAFPWLFLFPSPGLALGLIGPHVARWLPVIPRWPGFFAWAYAGHLVILAAYTLMVKA